MKKKNILLAAIIALVALTLPLTMKAQTNVWSIGPESGVSFSKYGNDGSSSEFRPGHIVGVFVTYSIINTFGLTTKLLYYEKGASSGSLDSKQTLQYIEMPMMGRFFLNKEGNIRPNIFLGPTIAVLAGARNTTGNNTEKLPSYEDSFNSVDWE